MIIINYINHMEHSSRAHHKLLLRAPTGVFSIDNAWCAVVYGVWCVKCGWHMRTWSIGDDIIATDESNETVKIVTTTGKHFEKQWLMFHKWMSSYILYLCMKVWELHSAQCTPYRTDLMAIVYRHTTASQTIHIFYFSIFHISGRWKKIL